MSQINLPIGCAHILLVLALLFGGTNKLSAQRGAFHQDKLHPLYEQTGDIELALKWFLAALFFVLWQTRMLIRAICPVFAKRTLLFFLLAGVLIFSLPSGVLAQDSATSFDAPPTPEMRQALAKAKSFIVSFKKDSAVYYSTILMDEVKERGMMETTFGLRVRLAHANALVLNRQGGDQMEYLLDVSESSSQQGLWDVYIESNLLIALLHENRNQAERSMESMQRVKSIIVQHEVDSMYPFYTIQMASYYRIFANNVDSSRYYAKETIRAARLYNLPLKEAWGNMLMAMLTIKTDEEAAMEYYRAAARLFLTIEDNLGHSYVYNGLAGIQYNKGERYKALAYNDTSIAILKKAFASGYIDTVLIFQPYKFRATIFHDLGKYDSAYYYLKKAAGLEMKYFQQEETASITEIRAKYDDGKRVQQLQEQAFQLQLEKNRRNGLLAVAFTILLSFSVLVYYFFQLRKANQKNLEQAEQLKNMDAVKSRFFANVSHELRTPLTLMLGPVKTLLNGHHSPQNQERLLNMALNSGKLLQQLVNDILDLRKLEMSKMELHEKPTELHSYFVRYASQFESLVAIRRIDFSIKVNVEPGVRAMLDREKCWQLIHNLLSNAFKFTPEDGSVQARLSLAGNTLTIEVADTGMGIQPEDLPRVFDRFFQVAGQKGWEEAQGGTGIGLAICHEYAQLFGGKMEVESPDPISGKGSVFRAVFPVTVLESTVAEEVEPIADIPPFQAWTKPTGAVSTTPTDAALPTILVVEDNPELQEYLRFILEGQYKVITAGNGKEALELLRDEGQGMRDDTRAHLIPHPSSLISSLIPHPSSLIPDLILSDLMMPVMNGYQLLEKLKSDDATRHIPVIMLTARAEARDRLKALRIGVDDYLTKPFDEEELLVRIENLLRNKAERQAVPLVDGEPEKETPLINEADRSWLESFEAFVLENYADDTLDISVFASEFAMSESTLLRQLKRLTGLTPGRYLQEVRLDKARQLLENRTGASIAEVAAAAGYGDANSFARSFKKRFGSSPSIFLKD